MNVLPGFGEVEAKDRPGEARQDEQRVGRRRKSRNVPFRPAPSLNRRGLAAGEI